ncbi:MAG: hypothetical protein VW683_03320 [Betaproteobacteria bacterium]
MRPAEISERIAEANQSLASFNSSAVIGYHREHKPVEYVYNGDKISYLPLDVSEGLDD